MRHHNTNRKLGRERDQRRALIRSLAINLIKNDRIETTEARAKELKKFVEKVVTRAKKGGVHDRRVLISKLGSGGNIVLSKLVDELAPKYKDRPGGYLRIIKKMDRVGSDGAPMVIIEFV